MEARGLDVDVWVRAQVADAITGELDGEVPPEPNYEARIRSESRLDLLRQLRLLVDDGWVLDHAALDRFRDTLLQAPWRKETVE